MSIRVALADDQDLVREGLRALLERLGIEVVLAAEGGAELLEHIGQLMVDVIIVDIRMPGIDGIALLRELRKRGQQTPVVMLTSFEDPELLLTAVEAGAQGFLLKGAPAAELVTAIHRAHRGERWLSPVATHPIYPHLPAPSDTNVARIDFAPRDLEILRLLAGGYSNKEIARSLNLADGTVKNYVSEILAKLGTRDRTRAVLKAITLQIV